MKFKEMVKNFNTKYIRLIETHYWLVLVLYLALTGFLGFHASQIEIKTRFLDLLPEKKESVMGLKKVVEYYGGEGYLIGVIDWVYPYSEPIEWMRKLDSETSKIHFDLNQALNRDNSEWLLDWLNKKDGRARIEALIEFYHTILDRVKGQLSQHPNEKYLNLFSRELSERVIPDTRKNWETFKKDPRNHIAGYNFLYALENNRSAFQAYINAILEKEGGGKELQAVAEKLAVELEKEKDVIKYVEYKFRTSFIKDHLLYFIDIPDLKDIKTRIQKKIDYERRKKVLSSYLLEDEPVKLDFTDIEEKYEKSTKVLKVTKKTDFFERSESEYEYYINKNEDRLLLLIKPSRESTDLGFAQNLVDRARAVSKRILEQNPNEKISIGYTGRYVKKLEDKEIIERDLKIITPVAFLMILISILIYFRRIRAVLVIGLPLASGLVWATGLVRLTIGHFNVITGFLLAILSGLGVDFGVHLYSRYIEERNRGKDIFESLEIVFRTTFLSNLTSTTTTAAAFFVLIISEFKGFSQFGYTAGMGMLLLLLGMLFAFPSIIVISDKIYPVRGGRQFRKVEHLRGKRVRFFRVIAWAGIIFTIFSMYGLFKANFNADFYSLGAPNTRVKKLEKKAEELIKMSLWPVIIYAQDWDTMKEVTKRINDLKDKGQLPTLDKLDSLYNYVPEKQEEKKKVMLEMKTLLRDSILSKLKGDEKKKVERLREIVDAGYIGLEDVPFELKRQFLGNKEGYFLFYYPNAGLAMSRVSTVKKMVDDLDKVSGQFKKSEIVLGSDAKIFYDIIQLIQREGPMIVALVLFAIFLLLWLDFKSFRSVLITLFPLTVGIIWIFGGMYLFGWKLNYFNIVMFPVIMGLGIDYGVHFFHRYKEEGRDHILFVMRTTGIAILIGGLTDIFGFGTLLFARYEGLATMGELAILGIATCIFAGILFMASLLEARKDAQHHGWLKTLIYRNPGSKK